MAEEESTTRGLYVHTVRGVDPFPAASGWRYRFTEGRLLVYTEDGAETHYAPGEWFRVSVQPVEKPHVARALNAENRFGVQDS